MDALKEYESDSDETDLSENSEKFSDQLKTDTKIKECEMDSSDSDANDNSKDCRRCVKRIDTDKTIAYGSSSDQSEDSDISANCQQSSYQDQVFTENETESKVDSSTIERDTKENFEEPSDKDCKEYISDTKASVACDLNQVKELDPFGLFSSSLFSSESKTDGTEMKNAPEDTTKRTVKVESELLDIEIPDTSFWKETKQLDLQELQQVKKRIEKHEGEKRIFSKRCTKVSVHHSASKMLKTEQSAAHVENTDETASVSHSDQTRRKMYFVHSKVAPYLHQKTIHCKVPSSKEWTHPAHAGAINKVRWNIASFSHLLVSCSMDTTVKIWNVWSQLNPCVQLLRSHDKAVKDVNWSLDGKQLLSSSYDRSAVLSDVETGTLIRRLGHRSYVTCGRYHPETPHLCVTGANNEINVWDMRTPSYPCRTFTYKDNIGQVQDIAFNMDGTQLFSCSDLVCRDSADRNLMAWDFTTGVTLSNQIYQERYTLTRLEVHPKERHLLAQSHGDYIAIFSLQKPYKMKKNKRFEGHKVQGYSIGFDISPDGQTVCSASSDGKLFCYNYQSGKLYRTVQTGLDVVLDVACHPVLQSTIALSSWDGQIQVWR